MLLQTGITIEQPGLLIALGGFILVLVLHTGALFYWGGSITRAMKDHDQRIGRLEKNADNE